MGVPSDPLFFFEPMPNPNTIGVTRRARQSAAGKNCAGLTPGARSCDDEPLANEILAGLRGCACLTASSRATGGRTKKSNGAGRAAVADARLEGPPAGLPRQCRARGTSLSQCDSSQRPQ